MESNTNQALNDLKANEEITTQLTEGEDPKRAIGYSRQWHFYDNEGNLITDSYKIKLLYERIRIRLVKNGVDMKAAIQGKTLHFSVTDESIVYIT